MRTLNQWPAFPAGYGAAVGLQGDRLGYEVRLAEQIRMHCCVRFIAKRQDFQITTVVFEQQSMMNIFTHESDSEVGSLAGLILVKNIFVLGTLGTSGCR